MTWARRLEDYPATDPRYPERSAEGVDRKTTYSEGVNVGYRWFDHENIAPLFAFGHGLSYTRFAYSALGIERAADGGLDVSVRIKNNGDVDGDEVPQVYLGRPSEVPAGVQFPVRSLAAFERIHLRAGRAQIARLHVPLRQLQYWSTANSRWVTAIGRRTLSVGASSNDMRLEEIIQIDETADLVRIGPATTSAAFVARCQRSSAQYRRSAREAPAGNRKLSRRALAD